MCILIGLQVCFIALWRTKMTWAMLLAVFKLWEFKVRASYTVFLFVKVENNFIKEIKHVHASIACWKPRQSLREFSSRWKPSTASRVFTDLLPNSPKRSPRFSPGYESTENMFYFLNKARAQYMIGCFPVVSVYNFVKEMKQ